MARVLDFDDGFETSTPPGEAATTVTGSSSSPTSITAAGGVTAAETQAEIQYVVGSPGAVDVSANPQVSAGTYDGQTLDLIGTSDTNTVLLENGNGLQLNGPCTLTLAGLLALVWDEAGSVWIERHRNGMA